MLTTSAPAAYRRRYPSDIEEVFVAARQLVGGLASSACERPSPAERFTPVASLNDVTQRPSTSLVAGAQAYVQVSVA